MYKIETHLHTKHVSRCGHMEAAEIIAAYKQDKYASFGPEHFDEASRAATEDMIKDIASIF